MRSTRAVTKVPLPEAVVPLIGVRVSQSTLSGSMLQLSVVPSLPTFFTWKVLVVAVSPKSSEPSLSCRMALP
ncbi:MAG: hypothetical protein II111_00960, partial [Oscillospiraceae bacterium]|nr:hypothetical protein [Oscillospiraceae bacterium]